MSRLALALAVEGVALLVVFASFFAGEARHAALGVGGVLLVAAALGGVAAGKAGARKGFWLWYASLAAYAFLYIPLAIVVAFSFNDSKLNAEWVGFTLAWYLRLAQDEAMLIAAGHSLLIAAVASAVATLLGTLAGMAMHARRLRLMPLLVFAPVAMPEILLGVSLLIFFLNVAQPALAAVGVDFQLGLISVIIAHITISISFVAIVVRECWRSWRPGCSTGTGTHAGRRRRRPGRSHLPVSGRCSRCFPCSISACFRQAKSRTTGMSIFPRWGL